MGLFGKSRELQFGTSKLWQNQASPTNRGEERYLTEQGGSEVGESPLELELRVTMASHWLRRRGAGASLEKMPCASFSAEAPS